MVTEGRRVCLSILKENLGVMSLVYEYGREIQKEYGALLSSTTGSRV